jgi:hypothetical protein
MRRLYPPNATAKPHGLPPSTATQQEQSPTMSVLVYARVQQWNRRNLVCVSLASIITPLPFHPACKECLKNEMGWERRDIPIDNQHSNPLFLSYLLKHIDEISSSTHGMTKQNNRQLWVVKICRCRKSYAELFMFRGGGEVYALVEIDVAAEGCCEVEW